MVAKRQPTKNKPRPVVPYSPPKTDLKVVARNETVVITSEAEEFAELDALLSAYRSAVETRRLLPRDGTQESREATLEIFRANNRILRFYWRIKYEVKEDDHRMILNAYYAKKRLSQDADGKWHEEHTMLSADHETFTASFKSGQREPTDGLGFIYAWGEAHGWPELCLDEAIADLKARMGEAWPYGFPILYTIAAGEDSWHALSRLGPKRQLLVPLAEAAVKKLGG